MNLVLIICIAVIVFLGGQLYFRQWSLVFKPSHKMIGSPADLGMAFEEHYLKSKKNTKMHCWWIPGPTHAKAVIFFHNHRGNITYELKTVEFLHSLGSSVLAVDYPGYGKSDGRPGEKACYDTADAAWDFVCQEKGFASENVILFGQSLGSAVAAYLAAKYPCGGLVFQGGSTSIPDMAAHLYPVLAVRLFCHTRLNSLKFIARCQCPVLIFHSKSDELVPIRHAHRIYLKAPLPKKFVPLKGSHLSNEWRSNPLVRSCWKELLNGQTGQWQPTESQ